MDQLHSQQNVRDSLKTRLESLKSQKNFNERDTIYINTLNKFGENQRFHIADSLLLLSELALEYSRSGEYKKGEIKSLINKGDYYMDKGLYKKSTRNYLTALPLANELHDTQLILHIQNKLATLYSYNSDYAKSLLEYLKGIELAKEVGNDKMLSVLTENVALLYSALEDYSQALVHFKTVKKLNDKISDEVFSAYTNSNIASTYADMGNLEHAMYNVNQSISVFEKHQIIDWLAYAFEVKGRIYLKQKKFKWSLFWYHQSKMMYDKNVEDERSELNLLNGIAEANMGLHKDSLSEAYALSALAMSTKMKEKHGVKKSAQILYKLKKREEDYITALYYHELFQRLSDTISQNQSRKNLVMLKTRVKHEQQKENLTLEIEKALAKQKNYIYITLGTLLVLLIITILVRRSEKIQKKLNKELKIHKTDLEKNEIKLQEINKTKDKLFSIIGHDLRGPIGAFQGLLQLFRTNEIDQTEFLEHIPKLGTDIDNISFTLNNLLSWGQTQMNGAITKPSMVTLENIVSDNIKLLREIADKKSIKLISRLPENTLVWSDIDQIDIVLRNLISNALKFTPKNGMVTVDAEEKNEHWQISVRDTGIGIDKDIQEKLFGQNSNITTYGTDDEKGTGIGLSLCKEMVENNKGTIWVESIPQKGSCFYFTVPKAKKEYEKTA